MKKKINTAERVPCKCRIVSLDLLSIFLKYQDKKDCIVSLLTDIKNKFGCITEEDLICITEHFDISENEIMEVVNLNNELEITPLKQHLIRVCRGIVCQICGYDKILEAASNELKIIQGNCTEDNKFRLEVVECVGFCEIAPIMAIDNAFYGNIDVSDATALIAHEKQKNKSC